MSQIRVTSLTKQFHRRKKQEGFWGTVSSLIHPTYVMNTAVDHISFQIKQGEIIGYIGPNGAGKSTTIKMLAGILVPTSGDIEVMGLVPYLQRKDHARQIGVVFGQRTGLWWDVPVIDSFRLLRDIYQISQAQYRRNLERYTDVLGLGEFLYVPLRQLSLGQRVRADIAAALMHDPSILFLDEPTIGVDVVSKERLRTFLREINAEQKVTILLTTHDMSEIEKLCQRVLVIDQGRILYDGQLEHVRTRYSTERILAVEFEENFPDFTPQGAVLQRSEGRKKWFSFNRYTMPASTLIASVSDRCPVADLTVMDMEIEAVIRSMYADQAGRLSE